ncbi:hypothetical protein PR048_027161 [Dryococelus australis]|uniref:Uncharacterized protein n=1 Tax=Dryococelus australis TaxID=614101 RepID=A0ABQ9GEP6_9NEOP|nr:hypothetical protein PR048_027161 [Dryococelus australis]
MERAYRKQSIDTHKTPHDRVKRCRERKHQQGVRARQLKRIHAKQTAVSPTQPRPIFNVSYRNCSLYRERPILAFSAPTSSQPVITGSSAALLLVESDSPSLSPAPVPTRPLRTNEHQRQALGFFESERPLVAELVSSFFVLSSSSYELAAGCEECEGFVRKQHTSIHKTSEVKSSRTRKQDVIKKESELQRTSLAVPVRLAGVWGSLTRRKSASWLWDNGRSPGFCGWLRQVAHGSRNRTEIDHGLQEGVISVNHGKQKSGFEPRSSEIWSGAGMKEWGKREIPEKTRQTMALSGTIPHANPSSVATRRKVAVRLPRALYPAFLLPVVRVSMSTAESHANAALISDCRFTEQKLTAFGQQNCTSHEYWSSCGNDNTVREQWEIAYIRRRCTHVLNLKAGFTTARPSALTHSRLHLLVSHPLVQSSHEHLTRRRPAISSRPHFTSLAHARPGGLHQRLPAAGLRPPPRIFPILRDASSLNVSETLSVERRSVMPASLATVGIHGIPRRGNQEAASALFQEEGRARWVSDYGAGQLSRRQLQHKRKPNANGFLVKQSAFRGILKDYIAPNLTVSSKDVFSFVTSMKQNITNELTEEFEKHGPLKHKTWGRGKRDIPEKTRRPTIPICENPVTRPGIEPGSPWWGASVLTAQPPWLLKKPAVIGLAAVGSAESLLCACAATRGYSRVVRPKRAYVTSSRAGSKVGPYVHELHGLVDLVVGWSILLNAARRLAWGLGPIVQLQFQHLNTHRGLTKPVKIRQAAGAQYRLASHYVGSRIFVYIETACVQPGATFGRANDDDGVVRPTANSGYARAARHITLMLGILLPIFRHLLESRRTLDSATGPVDIAHIEKPWDKAAPLTPWRAAHWLRSGKKSVNTSFLSICTNRDSFLMAIGRVVDASAVVQTGTRDTRGRQEHLRRPRLRVVLKLDCNIGVPRSDDSIVREAFGVAPRTSDIVELQNDAQRRIGETTTKFVRSNQFLERWPRRDPAQGSVPASAVILDYVSSGHHLNNVIPGRHIVFRRHLGFHFFVLYYSTSASNFFDSISSCSVILTPRITFLHAL